MQLKLEHIDFRYTDKSPWILKDVSLTIEAGERVGIVGPSGYGKSTLSKIIAGYMNPTSGSVMIDEKPLPKKGMCPVQMIYQHPEYAVNPRWKMKKILNECWTPGEEVLARMGIEKDWLNRWPSELSGGELQRFCIARALAANPRYLLADEITAMFDAVTQSQIWQALLHEAKERELGMVIVSHSESLLKRICTRRIDLKALQEKMAAV